MREKGNLLIVQECQLLKVEGMMVLESHRFVIDSNNWFRHEPSIKEW